MLSFDYLLPFLNYTSIIEGIYLYVEALASSVNLTSLHFETNSTSGPVEKTALFSGDIWSFDDFQFKLLKCILAIILANIIGISVVWNIYGAKISTRFMKTANQRTIEDLKKSVSMLKLPQEHSPRI